MTPNTQKKLEFIAWRILAEKEVDEADEICAEYFLDISNKTRKKIDDGQFRLEDVAPLIREISISRIKNEELLNSWIYRSKNK